MGDHRTYYCSTGLYTRAPCPNLSKKSGFTYAIPPSKRIEDENIFQFQLNLRSCLTLFLSVLLLECHQTSGTNKNMNICHIFICSFRYTVPKREHISKPFRNMFFSNEISICNQLDPVLNVTVDYDINVVLHQNHCPYENIII